MRYDVRFAPAYNPGAKGISYTIQTDDNDLFCGEKERIAMKLEKEWGFPWICVDVKAREVL